MCVYTEEREKDRERWRDIEIKMDGWTNGQISMDRWMNTQTDRYLLCRKPSRNNSSLKGHWKIL